MVLIRMGVVTDLVSAGKPKTAKELAAPSGGSDLLVGACHPFRPCWPLPLTSINLKSV